MKTIALSNSSEQAVVSDEDYERLVGFNWQLSSNGYAVRSVGTAKIYMHQDVLPTEKGIYADHAATNFPQEAKQ